MTPTRGIAGLAALAVTVSACTSVRAQLEPDYDRADKVKVKRLAVLTPADGCSECTEAVRALWSRMARRYVNLKRDFLAKKDAAVAASTPISHCEEGIEGVLWLEPELKRVGTGVEASLKGQLLRCPDGKEVWTVQAGGSWPSEDAVLKSTTQEYAAQFGAEVTPFVAPSFRLLKAALDKLPFPELTDEDVNEKINLDD